MTPDANELAALLDGRLSPPARERVLGQLAASPELSAIYADAIHALREQEAEAATTRIVDIGARTKLVPSAPPRSQWGVAALAAAAVLVIATGLLMRESVRSRTELGPSSATVALLSRPNVNGPVPVDLFVVTRGAADVAESPSGQAIRLGSLIALSELQLAAKDSLASITLERAAQSFDSVPAGSPVAATLRSIARSPANPKSAEALARASVAAESFVDARAMRVGAWLTAIRVAAQRKDSVFVRAPQSASAISALKELATNAEVNLRPDALAEVDALALALDNSTIDWQVVDRHAQALLTLLGR